MAGLLPDPFPAPDPVRFPNTRRRVSVSTTKAAARPNPPGMAPPSDPDTCRICRGDGSPDEPLFYPCKCSGSIKYVHQDCLMEWLSHSQKKHCELCKTPFRFTKLYDPNMPKALPTHIFVRHTTKYLLRNLLAWLRAGLVANVWLVWLPYLMRSVWSFLFWISDEGLGGGSVRTAADGPHLRSGALHGTNVCPSSPLFAATTTVAAIGGVIDNLPLASAKLVQGLYGINLTSGDPIYATILRLLFGTVGLTEKPAVADAAAWKTLPQPNHETLLSGVGFLRNLTRHPSVNRAVIAILEGQIITMLVIVCFILIILVRDYVVQQQPEINMRAAFAALENPPAPVVEAVQVPAEGAAEEQDFEAAPDDVFEVAGEAQEGTSFAHQLPNNSAAESSGRPPIPIPIPAAPPDEAGPRDTQEFDRATVHEYLDVYRDAGGDPEQILQIARERGLEARLDYWMRLTRSMMDRRRESEDGDAAHPNTPGLLPESPEAPGEDAPDSKGKGRLERDSPLASPLRPRANTDGPPISSAIHPLANNSWSFTDLPPPASPPEALFSDPPMPVMDYSPLPWETPAEAPADEATRPPSPSAHPGDVWQAPEAELETSQLPPEVHAVPDAHPEHRDLVDRVANFLWREVDDIPVADLAPINVLGDFFGEPEEAEPQNQPADQMARDREAAADRAAGLDAEAIEDAEDLEGVLELLGMRGPVAGLFQNAIFCAFLVSLTIFVGIFMPYNLGRIAIWAVANPARLARMLFGLSKFLQDCCLLALGLATSTVSESVHALSRALALPSFADSSRGIASASWAMAVGAAQRIGGSVVTELPIISASEMRNFSAISHEALLAVKERIALAFTAAWRLAAYLGGDPYTQDTPAVANGSAAAWESLKELPAAILNPGSWVLNLSLPETAGAVDAELAYWGGTDRFWAILAGYVAMSLSAGLYLRRGAPFSTTPAAREWEASLIDGLNQASGVMKVILIISIEMLVFPLYCGMLLDVALLPLFGGATLGSRLLFTVNYPVTSIFVHWFVGTGYMFHFALFVAMCRKIMRKGVLYFIRDPDDPEFHPVRDVLERNVTTQLRKILFSAFVYGALVIVCLGGVVWGLSLSLPGVLPIHYSSNEPVLEFPIDLLFYNFLMPLAVAFFKPSDSLHAMYTWWFRRCARALRITWFLFGERRVDEEGRLVLEADSPGRRLPFWRQLFLEVDANDQVVARTWHGIVEGGTAPLAADDESDHMMLCNIMKPGLVRSGQLVPDGRFVRAPASDQVKIPKGSNVFLEVTEDNARPDGAADRPVRDIYATDQYQLVYVPPHFRLRVLLFILSIWVFAAVTGVSITIVPLVFGRWMFRQLIPRHIRTNDVYAFSIGIHVLGMAAYALYHARSVYGTVKENVAAVTAALRGHAVQRVSEAVSRAARVAYTYLFVLVALPLLITSLMELYALIPLHEVMYSVLLRPGGGRPGSNDGNPAHTVRVVQAWTVGLLYLKLATRITNTWFEGSHVSNAARAVLRNGWLDPDVSILTRCFVVPGMVMWSAAVTTPLLVAKWAVAQGLADTLVQELGAGDRALHDAYLVLVYRLSFPLVALGVAVALGLWSMVGVFRSWQVRIRDEAYLIGERLHNFGGTNAPRVGGAWRAGARI